MKRVIAIVFGIGMCGIISAAAQTGQEKAACRPDAFRLCSFADLLRAGMGDREGIFQCFKQHRRELSPPCDRVLKSHGY